MMEHINKVGKSSGRGLLQWRVISKPLPSHALGLLLLVSFSESMPLRGTHHGKKMSLAGDSRLSGRCWLKVSVAMLPPNIRRDMRRNAFLIWCLRVISINTSLIIKRSWLVFQAVSYTHLTLPTNREV